MVRKEIFEHLLNLHTNSLIIPLKQQKKKIELEVTLYELHVFIILLGALISLIIIVITDVTEI